MFSSITKRTAVLTLLLSTFWVYQVAILRPGDKELVQRLQQEKLLASSKTQMSTTSQKREGVRKEIWFSEEEARLQYKIESVSSLLTFIPQENKVEVIENLENLKFWMQDKVYKDPSAQQLRFLEAAEGTYRMTSQEFLAHNVKVALFRLPGVELPELTDPRASFLQGIAESVFFSISGKIPEFEAQNFKASLTKG